MIGWLILLLVAAGIEAVMWARWHTTLSQQFWITSRRYPWLRWIMVIGLAILAAHLGWHWP
jgi:hypothetical protein